MNDSNYNELAKSLMLGTASEQEVGIALRSLQTRLSCGLIESLESLNKSFVELDNLLQRATVKYTEVLTQTIDSDTVSEERLAEIVDKLQKNQLSFLELQRKIVQSPTKLFPDDLISGDERKLLTMLKSFSTQDEKTKFLSAVENALMQMNSSDDNTFSK